MGRFKIRVYHPLLVAAYPVLALLAYNIEEVPASTAARALLAALFVAAILFVLARWLLSDWDKGGLVTSLTLILFFSYGHIYGEIRAWVLGGVPLGRHRLLAPLFLALWALVVWWIVRQKRDLHSLTRAVNIIALFLLAFPLLRIGRFYASTYMAVTPGVSQASTTGVDSLDPGEQPPDIYYIILDGYSRADTLQQFYGFDNTPFLDALADLGFYVARCSRSNYGQTQLSLASSLNMDYVQALDESYADEERTTRVGLPGFIRRSQVRQILESLGYQSVAFESGYYWTQVDDADFYLAPEAGSVKHLSMLGGANEFEVMLIKTSGWLLVADATLKLPSLLQPDLEASPKQVHRQRVLFTLEQLPNVPRLPSPKFVFVHIVSPHKPFVFGPDGNPLEGNADEIEGYVGQVAFINQRIIPILQQIIERSQTPPVIVIQGDHGGVDTDDVDRLRILNAYYLPGGGDQGLYDSITPVNTFRLILERYFGADYPLLEDISYSSSYKNPFKFAVREDPQTGCAP
jgi:hypothetical protein